jgi:hypothetical protein
MSSGRIRNNQAPKRQHSEKSQTANLEFSGLKALQPFGQNSKDRVIFLLKITSIVCTIKVVLTE